MYFGLDQNRSFYSCVACFRCVSFRFFSTKPRDWLGRTSPRDLFCVEWDVKSEPNQFERDPFGKWHRFSTTRMSFLRTNQQYESTTENILTSTSGLACILFATPTNGLQSEEALIGPFTQVLERYSTRAKQSTSGRLKKKQWGRHRGNETETLKARSRCAVGPLPRKCLRYFA